MSNVQGPFQMFRMATPHFGLYLFLFFYLLAGAWTFARLEDAADKEILKNKLNRLKNELAFQIEKLSSVSNQCMLE